MALKIKSVSHYMNSQSARQSLVAKYKQMDRAGSLHGPRLNKNQLKALQKPVRDCTCSSYVKPVVMESLVRLIVSALEATAQSEVGPQKSGSTRDYMTYKRPTNHEES